METKYCPRCEQNKTSDEFYDVKAYKGTARRKYWCCNDCHRVLQKRQYRKRIQRDPLAAYEQKLRKFGLTREQYLEKVAAQRNLCAICEKPETVAYRNAGRIKFLSVDHSHVTGQNRDLLCSKCNTALGLLDEDHARFQRAVDYLNRHELTRRKQK